MTKSLQEFNKEKLEEFRKKFGLGGFGDTKIYDSVEIFLSTALADQAKMIEVGVVPLEIKDTAHSDYGEGLIYGHNSCRQQVLDKFKELNK